MYAYFDIHRNHHSITWTVYNIETRNTQKVGKKEEKDLFCEWPSKTSDCKYLSVKGKGRGVKKGGEAI